MFERVQAAAPSQLLTPLEAREKPGVCFLRLHGWSQEAEEQLWRCHEAARSSGIILENGLPNPKPQELAYYNERVKSAFSAEESAVENALKAWLPTLPGTLCREMATGMARLYREETASGKPIGAVASLHVKMMCWLYYRFRGLLPRLGRNPLPLILCQSSSISAHAILMLHFLNELGADVLLLELDGEAAYLAADPASRWSDPCTLPGLVPFPKEYSLKELRRRKAAPPDAVNPASPPPPVIGKRSQQGGGIPPRPVIGKNSPQSTGAPKPVIGKETRRGEGVPPKPVIGKGSQQGGGVPPKPVIGKDTPQSTGAPKPVIGKETRQGENIPPKPVICKGSQQGGAIPPKPVIGKGSHSSSPPAPFDPLSRFEAPAREVRPNVWMKEASLDAVLIPPMKRGENQDGYNTVLIRMKGVRDKLTYANDLYLFSQRLRETGRRIEAVNREFDMPTAQELSAIRRRGKYASAADLACDLAGSLPPGQPKELTRLMQRAFVSTVMEESKKTALTALLQSTVILLAWIRRYVPALFTAWRETDMPCLILMGHCRTEREALFLAFLSRLPADVVIFAPNLSQVCRFESPTLLEIEGEQSLPEFDFPMDAASLRMRTVASHAEQELDTLLYSGSGLYRSQQFASANAMVLACTQDEVPMYWQQENRFRPGFSTEGGSVCIPVLFARENGAPEGDLNPYWHRIREMRAEKDTLFFPRLGIISPQEARRHMELSKRYLKDGRILKDALAADKRYPYGALRTEAQAHMLFKAQELIDQRLIRGTFENGTEFLILSAVLALPKEMTRLIQAYDFTKTNPKLLVVHTEESEGSLEDAVLLTYLSLLGFDVVLFVPTGYQTIERHLASRRMVEHEIGPYRFGVKMPDLDTLPPVKKGLQWLTDFLKRGI